MANLNQTLLEFQVYDVNDFGDEPNGLTKHKQYQALFYFVGLILGEITWSAVALSYYWESIDVAIILIVGLVWALTWSTIGLKKKYMYSSQYLFWMQACFHTLMFTLARITINHNFILCGSSTGIIFFIIMELCASKKVVTTKFFLYLYIWYALIFYDCMKRLEYAERIDAIMMILLDFYLLMSIIVFFLIAKKWRSYSKFGKWQIAILVYPLSLIFVMCIAGSFPENQFNYKWVWLTFINHGVFLCLCVYLFRNRTIIPFKMKQIPILEDSRQRLYQVSDVFLSPEQDHLYNPRESMQGSPPLSDCLICYDLKSTLCFMDCKHACVCPNCAVEILQRDRRQCLYCRKPSNYLLEVQRLQGIVFAINAKYRFKGV